MFDNYRQVETFLKDRSKYGMKPGLDRIHSLLNLLGNPQDKLKAVHVAGTNGKGSTVQFLKSALVENGYHVGVFTSPSLKGLRGHIYRDDDMISETELTGILNRIHPYVVKLDKADNHPTEFEIITAAAFMYFADNVDIALIEAGMGGREDTTNCFTPLLSIITNVDRDHVAFLGERISEIAYHKAGIIKRNTPVITGVLPKEAMEVIEEEAQISSAPLYRLPFHFTYIPHEKGSDTQSFLWKSESSSLNLSVSLSMDGKHQVENASLALKALEVLQTVGFVTSWTENLEALRMTRVPGRFERIQEKPTLILDGAHNPAGVQAFVETVSRNFQNEEKHLIFAAFNDKDINRMIEKLLPYFNTVTLTTFNHPRAADDKRLGELSVHSKVMVVADWKEAIRHATDPTSKGCFFVTGSLHFIANVRNYFDTGRKV